MEKWIYLGILIFGLVAGGVIGFIFGWESGFADGMIKNTGLFETAYEVCMSQACQ